MSYESPIKLITDLSYKIIEDQERNIYKAVFSYGIDISKDELFKLLYDDRKQYDKGHSDGYAKAKEELVRCKDCKYFGEADSEEPEYHECKYFSDWETVHYMLENDYCSCAERKDEVEE